MNALQKVGSALVVTAAVAVGGAFEASAQNRTGGCNGPGCPTGDTVNIDRRVQTRVENNIAGDRNTFVAAPGMAVSSGWCMESISASIGIASTPIALGLSKSDFSKLCGQWAAVTSGASNPTCPVGMYSVLWATIPEGTRNRERVALQEAINVCRGPAPQMPRNRGG